MKKPRIIYPKPPKMALRYRVAYLLSDLQIFFVFLAGMTVFIALMQSLPYLLTLN